MKQFKQIFAVPVQEYEINRGTLVFSSRVSVPSQEWVCIPTAVADARKKIAAMADEPQGAPVKKSAEILLGISDSLPSDLRDADFFEAGKNLFPRRKAR